MFEPTDDERKTVELMIAVGIPHEGIALCIRDGIDDKTLRKHFRKEIDTAKPRADAKVGGSVFQSAISGNVAAQKIWTGARMGWKEPTSTELTGKDGGPVEFTNMSDQALDAKLAALQKQIEGE